MKTYTKDTLTREAILTNDLIESTIEDIAWPNDEVMQFAKELSCAIAQAVLQLPEIQALRKDAERYRWLKKQFRIMSLDMGGNHTWVLQRPLREGCSIDAVCDASMEKQQ